jgi:hypothetical protein
MLEAHLPTAEQLAVGLVRGTPVSNAIAAAAGADATKHLLAVTDQGAAVALQGRVRVDLRPRGPGMACRTNPNEIRELRNSFRNSRRRRISIMNEILRCAQDDNLARRVAHGEGPRLAVRRTR